MEPRKFLLRNGIVAESINGTDYHLRVVSIPINLHNPDRWQAGESLILKKSDHSLAFGNFHGSGFDVVEELED